MKAPLLSNKAQLRKYKLDNDLLKRVKVSEEESKEFEQLLATKQRLPDGVFLSSPDEAWLGMLFYRVEKTNLTEDEIVEFMLMKQAEQIKSIKNNVESIKTRVTFFIVFFIILLVGAFLLTGLSH